MVFYYSPTKDDAATFPPSLQDDNIIIIFALQVLNHRRPRLHVVKGTGVQVPFCYSYKLSVVVVGYRISKRRTRRSSALQDSHGLEEDVRPQIEFGTLAD